MSLGRRVTTTASPAALKTLLFNNNHPIFAASSTDSLHGHTLPLHRVNCLYGVLCKVFSQKCGNAAHGSLFKPGTFRFGERAWIHSTCLTNMPLKPPVKNNSQNEAAAAAAAAAAADNDMNVKPKRKKLKGRRQVVRWLKFFRWKKKKEYERMTSEEKILYKLRKARNKEARILEALKKIEPRESSEATHDPEILTPEEHFYFLKMGLKCKNYVPVGRRGIYQGVILNMHLHWKKHQTLQVIVKTFTPEEVKEIAVELARLSGGIVLDIHEENTIIMYRGKNYSQPPTEIMSPRITLSRIKALNKSKYRDGLRAVRKFIPRLEQDLESLQAQAKRKQEDKMKVISESQETEICKSEHGAITEKKTEILDNTGENGEFYEGDSTAESGISSDSEGCLSDIFETDSDGEAEGVAKAERILYLDELERFPTESKGEADDFEEHLRQISLDPKMKKDDELPDLDEVDRIFLRAGSLLKKKRR